MTANGCIRCGRKAMILTSFMAGDTPFYLCAECTADFERFLSGYDVHSMVKISRTESEDMP